MKRKFIGLAMLMLFSVAVSAQSQIIYNLPGTSVHLEVNALKTVYTPGPYARFAEKYLGVKVSTKTEVSYNLESIRIIPYLEADRNARYVLDLGSCPQDAVRDLFLKFTAQGMVMLADQYKGDAEYWRFPTLQENRENMAQSATNNFTSTEAVLYTTVKNSKGGFDRVAISQTQVVKKSLEDKAAEAANAIFEIRKHRVAIITGDTDATFSGDALRASVETLDRLEHDYMSLFLGTYETATQKMGFDVLPKAENRKQIIVAFRFSNEEGLQPATEITGRPIVMEIAPENVEEAPVLNEIAQGKKKSKVEPQNLYYRVPSICLVKILDGTELLLQSRIPIYQAGETLSLPIYINDK